MKNKFTLITALALFASITFAGSTRSIDTDIIKSSDHTKTWTPPAATDTLVGRASSDTLTNKTMDGGSNTFTNLPATGITGTLATSHGGTGQDFSASTGAISISSGTMSAGTLSQGNGGTGFSTYALGDILYSSATNTLSKLAGNTTSTKKYLSQTGTGTVSAAPSWLQPACGDLSNAATSCSTDTTNAGNISSGLLALARGGTNADLSGTGGASQVLKQTSVGGAVSVARLACADLSNSVASCSTDTTSASNISSGTLAVAQGGTGRGTLTSHGVLIGAGTSAITQLAAAGAGTMLQGVAASDPAFSATPTLGLAGTATGALNLAGTTSGTITIQPQAAAGTYNFNLPITVGTAGQVLTSQAGGSTAMTWTSALTNPMTTKGDIIASADGSGTPARVGVGSNTQVLTANSAATNGVDWEAVPSAITHADEMLNQGLSITASSNILTISLKQSDGSTAPSTGTAAVKAAFRSSTATSGLYNERSVTAALTQTLTQGTVLNAVASTNSYIWFYLIDSDGAGTMKLGASSQRLDEGTLQSTLAESFSATATNASPAVFSATAHGLNNGDQVQLTGTPPTGFSTATTYYVVAKAANTFELAATEGGAAKNSSSTGSSIVVHIADNHLVSDAVYTSMPIRIIGRAQFSLSTPGNWAAPAEVSLPKAIGQGITGSGNVSNRINYAVVGVAAGACTTSPCTISAQSGSWLTQVTRTSTGIYTMFIANGEYTAKPTCFANDQASTGHTISFDTGNAGTSTSMPVTSTSGSGTATDIGFNVICIGTH